ncbi:MAG: sulfur carrier protein ThiS [Spirochaetaceae bacterium]
MILIINGEKKQISESILMVTELLKVENVDMPDMVSVQLNGEFVEREDFDSTKVSEGDEVDFLYFMGGGSR